MACAYSPLVARLDYLGSTLPGILCCYFQRHTFIGIDYLVCVNLSWRVVLSRLFCFALTDLPIRWPPWGALVLCQGEILP